MITIILAFSLVSYRFTRERIVEMTDKLIYESTSSWRYQFEGYFQKKEVAIDIAREYMEANLTLGDLKDPELLNEAFSDFFVLAKPVLTGLSYLDLYCWLDPRRTSEEPMQVSVRNLKQDGNISAVTDSLYGPEDMDDPSWDWFNIPMEEGSYITDPYDWEGFSQKLVSYTNVLTVEGIPAGVVGSDMYIGELSERLQGNLSLRRDITPC